MSNVASLGAVRWDTNSNKIIFNLDKGSLEGQLILRRNRDGRIDMYLNRDFSRKNDERKDITTKVCLAE